MSKSRPVIAHSRNSKGLWDMLDVHLTEAAELAVELCPLKGFEPVIWVIVVTHDGGKIWCRWQDYAHGGFSGPSPGHVGPGVLWGVKVHPVVGLITSSHHSGLPDRQEHKENLATYRQIAGEDGDGLYEGQAKEYLDPLVRFHYPGGRDVIKQVQEFLDKEFKNKPMFDRMMICRTLLSVQVDADHLKTEAHFNSRATGFRKRFDKSLHSEPFKNTIKMRIEKYHKESSDTVVNRYRRRALASVFLNASTGCSGPGIYMLDAPTGAGKTFQGIVAAVQNGSRKFIYAAPFNSILDQTGETLRDLVGAGYVVEHHTGFDPRRISVEEDTPDDWREIQLLVTQNYQTPVVVTSHPQLLETLFSYNCRKLRKLHRYADSTIMLDEFHNIPIDKFAPVMKSLAWLVEHFRCRIILSSATPIDPAILKAKFGLDISMLDDTTEKHRGELTGRVQCVPIKGRLSWVALTNLISEHPQVMVTLNKRKHVEEIYRLMGGLEGLYILTSYLTPFCRLRRIREIKERIAQGKPVTLIATPVCECGVDISFPVGFRCMTRLESIIQAAGRINRNGEYEEGVMYVFETEDDYWFPALRIVGQFTQPCLKAFNYDLTNPEMARRYHQRVLGLIDTDGNRVLSTDNAGFRDVDQRMTLIEDETVSVFVPVPGQEDIVNEAYEALCEPGKGYKERQALYRTLRPYAVSLYPKEFDRAMQAGFIEGDKILLWKGPYSLDIGLQQAV